jgi:dTDP-4-dehydrorhamnose reductase
VKLLLTGSGGQLGRAVAALAPSRGHTLVAVDLPGFDITDAGAVRSLVDSVRPDVIVNAAAFTAVDAAETAEDAALAVNGTAVGYLARACEAVGATLAHVSTDYVFDGGGDRPWREDDAFGPRSAYGRTKLAGELAARLASRHVIARTAWLFGDGPSFVTAIRKQLDSGNRRLSVVADQRGCPTYAVDLADALLRLLDAGATGTFHVVNDGATTWHGFAVEIVRQLGLDAEVIPVSTAQFPRPAPRPANSVLDTSKLRTVLGGPLPPWQDALARYLTASGAAPATRPDSV